METTLQKTNGQTGVKELFSSDVIKAKFTELLGSKAQGFMTSVLQIANSDELLKKADPNSIYNAAAVAATLDLPLNNNLGFAWIVPYNQKQPDGTYKQVAQFQLGAKGFIQLAQRSGQFKTINATDVREGEIKSHNRLTGEIEFEWLPTAERLQKNIIGFVAYFKLLNGFEKSMYMTNEELRKHGAKYSKTFKNQNGLWNQDFESMATKTVIKQVLSKFAPLSIAMQRAVIADQSLINNADTLDTTYVDNDEPVIDREAERVVKMIEAATSIEDLDNLYPDVKDEQMELFLQRKEELSQPISKGKKEKLF